MDYGAKFVFCCAWISACLFLFSPPCVSGVCEPVVRRNASDCLKQGRILDCGDLKRRLCCANKYLEKCPHERRINQFMMRNDLPEESVMDRCSIPRQTALHMAKSRCNTNGDWIDIEVVRAKTQTSTITATTIISTGLPTTTTAPATTTAIPTTMEATTAIPTTTTATTTSAIPSTMAATTLVPTTTKRTTTLPVTTTAGPATTRETTPMPTTIMATTVVPTTIGETTSKAVTTRMAAGVATRVMTTGEPATKRSSQATHLDVPVGKKTYKVVTKLVEPWLTKKGGLLINATLKNQVEGYVIDLLEAIAQNVNFDYELYLQKDDLYGSKKNDGSWTGMIGELWTGDADIAASLITVTVSRESVVDFTYPLHSSEAYVLLRKENKMDSLEEVINTERIKLGTVKDSPIYEELWRMRNGKGIHEDIMKKMIQNTDNLKTVGDGILKAREDSDYAFIVDGMTRDWVMKGPSCDLKTIKAGIYRRKHAFAVRNYSPLRDIINKEITNLYYAGKLDQLKKKWLGDGQCNNACPSGGAIYLLVVLMLLHFLCHNH